MVCFYHEDRDAVGTCKSCGRGLCQECAVDLSKGLACRGRCETDAQAFIQLIDSNILREVKTGRAARSANGIFFILMGVLFAAWGLSYPRPLIAIMGVMFIGYGFYWLHLAGTLGKKSSSPSSMHYAEPHVDPQAQPADR